MESHRWALMCQASCGMAMSKWDYTLGFSETQGMGIGAVVVSVVVSLAVETVFAYGAIPNRVSGMKLFAESTPMREWEGLSGTASL